MKRMQLMLALAALAAVALPAGGDEADAMFQALFAARVRSVQATRGRDDDLKLAEEMVLTVRNTEISVKLAERVCESAYGLAVRVPAGRATALSALRLLAAKVPARRAEAAKKISQLLLRAYQSARGDERKQISATIAGECESAGDGLAGSGQWQAAAEQYELAARHAPDSAARERLRGKHTAAAFEARVAAEIARLTARVKRSARDRGTREQRERNPRLTRLRDRVRARLRGVLPGRNRPGPP